MLFKGLDIKGFIVSTWAKSIHFMPSLGTPASSSKTNQQLHVRPIQVSLEVHQLPPPSEIQNDPGAPPHLDSTDVAMKKI
jgi:hypothetical protein